MFDHFMPRRYIELKIINTVPIFVLSVPSLWKDSLSLENIANDFLESNVTGEVMNLDDFLKELQVSELSVASSC
jgi:hypothetical protein